MYRISLLFIIFVSVCHLQAQRYQRKPITIIPSHRMSAVSELLGDIQIQKGNGANVNMGDSSATITHTADVITHIGVMLDRPLRGSGQSFSLLCDTKAIAGSAQQLNYAGFFLSDNVSNKILFFAVDASGQFLVLSFTDGKGIKVEKNLTPNRNILRGNGQVNHIQLSNRYGQFGDLLAGSMNKAKLYFTCNDSLLTSFTPDEDVVLSGAGVIKGGPGTAEISRFRLTEMGYETIKKRVSLAESIPWIADAAPLQFAPFRDPASKEVYPAPTLSVTGAGKAELSDETLTYTFSGFSSRQALESAVKTAVKNILATGKYHMQSYSNAMGKAVYSISPAGNDQSWYDPLVNITAEGEGNNWYFETKFLSYNNSTRGIHHAITGKADRSSAFGKAITQLEQAAQKQFAGIRLQETDKKPLNTGENDKWYNTSLALPYTTRQLVSEPGLRAYYAADIVLPADVNKDHPSENFMKQLISALGDEYEYAEKKIYNSMNIPDGNEIVFTPVTPGKYKPQFRLIEHISLFANIPSSVQLEIFVSGL